jgi:hypothetical protein
MALKLGNTTASLYLGSTPVAAYLGAEQVYSAVTVPGAPTIFSIDNFGGEVFVAHTVPASGGSTITGYKYYLDGVEIIPTNSQTFGPNILANFFAMTGQSMEVSAVNAIGEGQKSDPGFIPPEIP